MESTNFGMYIGINGFGRIGKCLFLQLMKEKMCRVKAINIPNFDVNNIKQYLEYDSNHSSFERPWKIEVIDESSFSVDRGLGKMVIHVLNNRDPSKLNWKKYGIDYVIDTTGAYLTTDSCEKHNVEYVIMCAPPKDNTDQFVVGVNHHTYKGERVVSNASCTTNCITPVLQVLEDTYGVERASFTTIHSTTASQNTVDTNNFKARTSRSIINNIIPHSTGANKSVTKLIPSLAGKIQGTSLRVPVANVSIVDLVITLKTQPGCQEGESTLTKEHVMSTFESCEYIEVCKKALVSSDYMTTHCPSIVDFHASMKVAGANEFKLMIWYDNEWSYSAQVIKLAKHMGAYNFANSNRNPLLAYYIKNRQPNFYEGKTVVIRVDWNVPVDEALVIQDDYRITSSLKTIQHVLKDGPAKVILCSHLGRPDSKMKTADWQKHQDSWAHYLPQLKKHFEEPLTFLPNGLSKATIEDLKASTGRLFLLENLRFHPEETGFAKIPVKDRASNEAVQVFNSLGDYYVNDAFACCHRNHLSIVGFDHIAPEEGREGGGGVGGGTGEKRKAEKAFGYLIGTEMRCLESVAMNKNNDKILAIIGGGKMDDKLALLQQLVKKVDGVYIGGGNVNSIFFDSKYKDYLEDLGKHKAKVYIMTDGLAASDLTSTPSYMRRSDITAAANQNSTSKPNTDDAAVGPAFADRKRQLFYDIGMESIIELKELIDEYDTVFWNGTLGVVENKLYSYGSTTLVHLLMKSDKKVLVGGGDTASFVQHFPHNFHFVSTGGGASIDYIASGNLAGLKYFHDDTEEKEAV